MKEIFTMWRHTQLVVLVALSAAIYAAVLIPFKGFPIVPGYIELRPANAFPIVFGLLFGPAGAWGSAIGNTIGDFVGGTLTLGSVGGFVGNFFLALLPYKMWSVFLRRDENMETNVDSSKKFGVYILVTILASTVCAVIIAWWVDLLGLFPFRLFLGTTLDRDNRARGGLVFQATENGRHPGVGGGYRSGRGWPDHRFLPTGAGRCGHSTRTPPVPRSYPRWRVYARRTRTGRGRTGADRRRDSGGVR
jgi:hypothetical protein